MKTVIIDNYDSFTYNLSQILQELGAEVTVLRKDSPLARTGHPRRSRIIA